MKSSEYKIFSLGTNSLTIEFGSEISIELNERAINLAKVLDENRFPGFTETVPAYASLTVFFDVYEVRKHFPEFSTAFEAVRDFIEKALQKTSRKSKINTRLIEIPVDFSPDCALDLELIAAEKNLSTDEFVRLFTSRRYRVFMIGFLPAFAYMGEIDKQIAAPRKPTPRMFVPRGSVGIAGRQTGIYPFDSPGGWQIIGRTDFELFTPQAEIPCALNAGDLVKFYPVEK